MIDVRFFFVLYFKKVTDINFLFSSIILKSFDVFKSVYEPICSKDIQYVSKQNVKERVNEWGYFGEIR